MTQLKTSWKNSKSLEHVWLTRLRTLATAAACNSGPELCIWNKWAASYRDDSDDTESGGRLRQMNVILTP